MIEIGIIGAGYWGPNMVRNFQSLDGCRVKAVADLSSENLAKIKNLYPEIAVTKNYRDILKDSRVEAVNIVTPAVTHYPLIREALLAGKHVLSEKPMTVSSKQAKVLIGLAKKQKKVLMVGNTFEYSSPVRKIKEMLEGGDLGKPLLFYLEKVSLGPIRSDVSVVWDFAYHDISALTYWLGKKPLKVSARGLAFLRKNLDDFGFINLEFPGNIFAHIRAGWLYPQKERGAVIVGAQKMLVYDDLNKENPLTLFENPGVNWRAIGKNIYPKVDIKEPLKVECEHFLDCIKNNKIPLTDGKRGLEIIEILEAVQKSINLKGKEIGV